MGQLEKYNSKSYAPFSVNQLAALLQYYSQPCTKHGRQADAYLP